LLVHPDGTAELLGRRSDLLLGLDPTTSRDDHTAELAPGSTVLFFTDGLVERRGWSIDDGFEWLRNAVAGLSHLELNELCDELLAQLDVERAEDDVAMLAVRAHPQN
jgi:serine phosphatase RsbU (regulator of sigma subunit)